MVEGSELVVTREAFANNTSKYLLNGKTSTFTDVTEVFKDKGVDLDNNRFLILQARGAVVPGLCAVRRCSPFEFGAPVPGAQLSAERPTHWAVSGTPQLALTLLRWAPQGEVEQISMMRPKAQGPHDEGLLEYLEDIIGSDKYVADIETSAKACVGRCMGALRWRAPTHPRALPRLEELNEQRMSQVQRLKVVEKEREGLEGAKSEAESCIAKERELLRWRGTLFQLWLSDAQANVVSLEASTGELTSRLEHERAKHSEYTTTLAETEARHAAAAKEHGVIAGELEVAREEFKEFERKDIKAREDLKHAKAKAKKLEDRQAGDAAKLVEQQQRAAQLAAELPGLEAKRSAAEAALAAEEQKLDAIVASLSGELQELGSQLSTVEKELQPWEARMAEAKARCEVARQERDLLVTKHEQAVARAQAARDGAVKAASEAQAHEAQAAQLQKELSKHAAAAAAARQEEASAQAAASAAQQVMQASRSSLEARKAVAAETSGRSTLMKALLAAKASGKLPGLVGRLGDLGVIDPKYDVAVSTAAGALDNIVVESTEDAQACVALLRAGNLGVATFLILDKQAALVRDAEAGAPGDTPEGVARLYDLIKPAEPRFKAAFYFALRNTLVAVDLEQATRISYAKGTPAHYKRIVTLDGQLVEASGTMSGGGGKPKGGRMRTGAAASAARPADVADAEAGLKAAMAEYETASKAASAAVAAAEAAGARATRAEEALAAAQREVPKLQLAAQSLRCKADDLRAQQAALDSAAAQSAEDAARLVVVRQELDAAVFALAEAQKGAASLQAKAGQLRKAMEDAGGMKLRNARAAVARLQKEIEDASEGAAQRRAGAAAAEKAVVKLAKAVEETAAERAALAADTEAKKKEFAALEEAAGSVLEHFNATQALLDAKAGELAQLKARHEEAKKAVAVIRGVEVEIGAKLEDLARDLKAEQEKVRLHDKKLAAVRKERQEADKSEQLPPLLSPEELGAFSSDSAMEQVTLLEAELATLRPDMSAIAAWRSKEDEYCRRADELRSLTERRDGARHTHDGLRKRRLEEFMAGFNTISLRLKEMYQMITLGGDAELELVDSLDPFAEGIVFSVRPPKKSWKNIANLSGGEKTLSSLALVFALHHYKPTPLYVMDEIDAALDFKNVSIVAHYIKERTRDAQFIIISLRNNMFELADRLVGIYKTDNATKSITINPRSFAVGPPKAAAEAGGEEEVRPRQVLAPAVQVA